MEYTIVAPKTNFGKEIATAVVQSAAIYVGALATLLVVGYAANKFFELKDARTIKNQNKK